MRPHYSHPSRENATPSSGTSPVASCKETTWAWKNKMNRDTTNLYIKRLNLRFNKKPPVMQRTASGMQIIFSLDNYTDDVFLQGLHHQDWYVDGSVFYNRHGYMFHVYRLEERIACYLSFWKYASKSPEYPD